MYWIFLILYIAILFTQIFYLFKSIKNKDNKYWITLFSIITSSILSCILIIIYENFNTYSTSLDGVVVILFSAIAILLYFCVLVLSILLKLFQIRKLKHKEIVKKTKNKKLNKKRLLIPVLSIFLLFFGVCLIELTIYEHLEKIENKRYNTVKKEKLSDMVNYINNKYDVKFNVNDNIFYREYKYSEVELAEKKHNDFYIGIFDNGNETITVSINKDDFLSDNAQIEDIYYLIRDYYSNLLGVDIGYIEIRNNNGYCQDDLINETLQFKFNKIVTKDNIENFIDELLKNNVEIIFYVKDTKNREILLKGMINKLSYLEDNDNIKGLSIYLYNSKEDIIVEKNRILLHGDYKYDNIHLDYYSSYMFGFIYIPNSIEFAEDFDKENTFVTIAFSNKKYDQQDKYKNKDTKIINDWTVYNFK